MSEDGTFKKINFKNKFARKRKQSSSDSNSDDSESESQVIRNSAKSRKSNPNVHQTSIIKSKKSVIKNDENDSNEEEVSINYKSSRSSGASGSKDQGATAIVEIDTEIDRDAQALFEKRMEVNKDQEGKADDKVYRGLNNYTQYYKKKDSALGNASSGLVRQGPIRAPANLRATVRWDYQPDICKDYKETGYCGFGDSCKFLHDRSDYKAGWQLEMEYNANKKDDDSDGDETKYEIPSDEEDFPFKCFICRNSFVDPIVTKCKHYFCEKCALENYKKSKRCFVCGIQTNGNFNPARNLIVKLKAREKEGFHNSSDSEE